MAKNERRRMKAVRIICIVASILIVLSLLIILKLLGVVNLTWAEATLPLWSTALAIIGTVLMVGLTPQWWEKKQW
jgi:hypothetical protein